MPLLLRAMIGIMNVRQGSAGELSLAHHLLRPRLPVPSSQAQAAGARREGAGALRLPDDPRAGGQPLPAPHLRNVGGGHKAREWQQQVGVHAAGASTRAPAPPAFWFVRRATQPPVPPHPAARRFDADGDGYMHAGDLRALLESLGRLARDEEERFLCVIKC